MKQFKKNNVFLLIIHYLDWDLGYLIDSNVNS